MRASIYTISLLTLAIASAPSAIGREPPVGEATETTAKANAAVAATLPLDEPTDFEDAKRGRIAQIAGGVIYNAKGEVVWNANERNFLSGEAPATVNPSLWRQSKLLAEHGLFEVMKGIYQIRGYDQSVMTFIQGKTGWVIVDPLTAVETAKAGLELVNKTLGAQPVSAVVITHSHADHFGGIAGILTTEQLSDGLVPIVAPHGFLLEAVSENLLAGNYMGRRATFQFGTALPFGPAGSVSSGLGPALPQKSIISLAKPTREVGRGEAPIDLDGVTFEFIDAEGTEAPSEFMFYLPQFKALSTAEVVTGTLHNILTPRGAKVRDTLGWSKAIDEVLRLYGDKSDVVFASHHWPTWGSDNVRSFLANQRDTYRFIHDQTVRLANNGETMTEIAEQVGEADAQQKDLSTRGYYGTNNHNSKAVFQYYFGWWDGVPANYNRHVPTEESKRYVAAMGGAAKALKTGIAAFDAGDYRWSSVVFNHLIFADPKNEKAKKWLAASYEQQGFQAEAGSWRNYFLTAASELRAPAKGVSVLRQRVELLRAIPTEQLFDALAVRYNPAKSQRPDSSIQFSFPDRKEELGLSIRASVIVPRLGETLANPTVKLTINRADFDRLIAQDISFGEAFQSGLVKVEGDPTALGAFFASLDTPPAGFEIVTP